jgi:hypothetical protein
MIGNGAIAIWFCIANEVGTLAIKPRKNPNRRKSVLCNYLGTDAQMVD